MRSGHAYAENFSLHGASPERFKARELGSVVVWGGVLPALGIGLAGVSRGTSLLALALYLPLFVRVRSTKARSGIATGDATWYALFVVIGKLAQFAGAVWFGWNRVWGRRAGLIEYKRVY